MSAAGWRLPAYLTGGEPLDRQAVALASEFPGFDIRICRMHAGRSLVALRRGGAAGDGLTAVITPDADEMRRLLAEDTPPGAGGNQARGGG